MLVCSVKEVRIVFFHSDKKEENNNFLYLCFVVILRLKVVYSWSWNFVLVEI